MRGSYPFSDSIDEPKLTDLSEDFYGHSQPRTLEGNGFKPFPTELLTLLLARAIRKTSSICLTGIKFIFVRTYGGRSMRSFVFRYGMTTSLILFLSAARAFSFKPPTGKTLPLSVISPVMAKSFFTGRLVRAEKMETAMVMPAEGPSFGMAPAGTWIWISLLLRVLGLIRYAFPLDRT